MAAGWESGSTAGRDCSCTTPALALAAGAVRQWFGEVPGPGARSGHSPQGGGLPPGQQSWCWVAAAQVIAGIATLKSENQTISRLVKRRLKSGSGCLGPECSEPDIHGHREPGSN